MKTKHPVLVGCGTAFGIFLILMVAGLIWLSTGPDGGVRLPNEMENYAVEYLIEHKILDDSEDLLAYYDVTVSLDGSIAAILTTKRVIYHNEGRNMVVNLEEIADIRHRKETFIGDVFEILSNSGQTMKIEVAPMNQGETFKNVLMDTWEKVKEKKPINQ
jgi:hypothetical protein